MPKGIGKRFQQDRHALRPRARRALAGLLATYPHRTMQCLPLVILLVRKLNRVNYVDLQFSGSLCNDLMHSLTLRTEGSPTKQLAPAISSLTAASDYLGGLVVSTLDTIE